MTRSQADADAECLARLDEASRCSPLPHDDDDATMLRSAQDFLARAIRALERRVAALEADLRRAPGSRP